MTDPSHRPEMSGTFGSPYSETPGTSSEDCRSAAAATFAGEHAAAKQPKNAAAAVVKVCGLIGLRKFRIRRLQRKSILKPLPTVLRKAAELPLNTRPAPASLTETEDRLDQEE